jgi:hypothetical protein
MRGVALFQLADNFQEPPSLCLIGDRRSLIHGRKPPRSHPSGLDILTLCNTRTWGLRNLFSISPGWLTLALNAVSRSSPHRD